MNWTKFKSAIKAGFANSTNFRGRAARHEYWYFVLFTILLSILGGIIDAIIFGANGNGVFGFQTVAYIATALPGVAVLVRRLHDTGRSGWWQLIAITIVGFPILFYWLCQKGGQGDNRYGLEPLNLRGIA